MSITETRREQIFPVLDQAQIEAAKRFASGASPRLRSRARSCSMLANGKRLSWLVLKGTIDAIGRDGRGRETYITTHHAGQFSGELSQLAGRQSLAIGQGRR